MALLLKDKEVEEEFLENASTMVKYAREEIKQFLAWTDKRKPYGCNAEALILKLEGIASEVKALKKEYKNR